MNKIIALVATLIVLAGLFLATQSVYSTDKTDLHMIIFAQDPKTEIEVELGKKKETVFLDAGVNYISYAVKSDKVAIWAYGERVKPIVDKGRDGDFYTIVTIRPPGESVGE